MIAHFERHKWMPLVSFVDVFFGGGAWTGICQESFLHATVAHYPQVGSACHVPKTKPWV